MSCMNEEKAVTQVDLFKKELIYTKLASKTRNAWVLDLPFSKDTSFNGETGTALRVLSDKGVRLSTSTGQLHCLVVGFLVATFGATDARISLYCDQQGRYHARGLQFSVLQRPQIDTPALRAVNLFSPS